MSGVDFDGRQIRKGSADAIEKYVQQWGGTMPNSLRSKVDQVAKSGGTPLVPARGCCSPKWEWVIGWRTNS